MNWHDFFSYNKETGKLSWKERPKEHFATAKGRRLFNTRFAERKAGTPHSCGYEQIMLTLPNKKRELFLVHRIIWEMHNGPIHKGLDIDHIDRNRSNNKIENLRLATRSQNLQNSAYERGVCALPGVSYDKRRKKKPYYSRVRFNGKPLYLGVFSTAEEAHLAWKKACTGLGLEFKSSVIIDVA